MFNKPSKENKKLGRYKADYTLPDLWKYYCQITPEESRVSKQVFSDIIMEANKAIARDLISQTEPIRLFAGLGELKVLKRKLDLNKSKLRIDFATSIKLNKKVYHLNDHRGGFYYRIVWSKFPKHMGSFHKFYVFSPSRGLRRSLAKVLKNKPEIDFYVAGPGYKRYHSNKMQNLQPDRII